MAGDKELIAAAEKAVADAKKAPKRVVDSGSIRYDNAGAAECKALWDECGGRDKVMALGVHRKMTFDQIRAALKK